MWSWPWIALIQAEISDLSPLPVFAKKPEIKDSVHTVAVQTILRLSFRVFMTFKKISFIVLVLLASIGLGAAPAMAWGPGFHIALGNSILSQLHLLSSPVAAIISQFELSFLYGCLSADILVGKGKTLTPNHCHSWEAGLRLTRAVKTPEMQAYAYGYLTHLAADVIAHNYYVPNILQLGPGRGKFSHVYVEMQADRKTDFSKEQLKQVIQEAPKEADTMLLSILRKSRMAFGFKKKIFKGGLVLSRQNSYDSSLNFMEKTFAVNHVGEYFQDMQALSRQVAFDCLGQFEQSPVVQFDPMGYENLDLVKERKKRRNWRARRTRDSAMFFIPAMCLLTL